MYNCTLFIISPPGNTYTLSQPNKSHIKQQVKGKNLKNKSFDSHIVAS